MIYGYQSLTNWDEAKTFAASGNMALLDGIAFVCILVKLSACHVDNLDSQIVKTHGLNVVSRLWVHHCHPIFDHQCVGSESLMFASHGSTILRHFANFADPNRLTESQHCSW